MIRTDDNTRAGYHIWRGLVAFAVLAPFTFATEPIPAPYHQYLLSGMVSRASNGPRAFFVVSLNGKFKMIQTNPPGDLSGLYAFNADNSTPAITDSNGTFYLRVSLSLKPDSLAVRVAEPDKPPFVGPYFSIPEAGAEITRTYTETESGCSGCSTNPATTTQVIGYRYYLSSQTIQIPY